MKKIKYIVFSLILLLPVLSLSAQTIKKDDVPVGTYVIGTHMFTREVNTETGYEGKLTTELIMLASKTIEGNNLEDMVILYKNPRGKWINAMSAESVEVSDTFNIEYKDKDNYNEIDFDSLDMRYITSISDYQLDNDERLYSTLEIIENKEYRYENIKKDTIYKSVIAYLQIPKEDLDDLKNISFDLEYEGIELYPTFNSNVKITDVIGAKHFEIKDLSKNNSAFLFKVVSDGAYYKLKNIVGELEDGRILKNRDIEKYFLELPKIEMDYKVENFANNLNEESVLTIKVKNHKQNQTITGYEIYKTCVECDYNFHVYAIDDNSFGQVYTTDNINDEYQVVLSNDKDIYLGRYYSQQNGRRVYGEWSSPQHISFYDTNNIPVPALDITKTVKRLEYNYNNVTYNIKAHNPNFDINFPGGIELYRTSDFEGLFETKTINNVLTIKEYQENRPVMNLYTTDSYRSPITSDNIHLNDYGNPTYTARYYYEINGVKYYGAIGGYNNSVLFDEYSISDNGHPTIKINDTINDNVTGWELYKYDSSVNPDIANGTCHNEMCVVDNKAYLIVKFNTFEDGKDLEITDDYTELADGESATYIARFFKHHMEGDTICFDEYMDWSEPMTVDYGYGIQKPTIINYTLLSGEKETFKNVEITLDTISENYGWELYKRAENQYFENAPAIIDGSVYFVVNRGTQIFNSPTTIIATDGYNTNFPENTKFAVRYYKVINGEIKYGPWSDILVVKDNAKLLFDEYSISDNGHPTIKINDTINDNVTGWELYKYDSSVNPDIANGTCHNEMCVVDNKAYLIVKFNTFEDGKDLEITDDYTELADGESATYIARFFKHHMEGDTICFDEYMDWSEPMTVDYGLVSLSEDISSLYMTNLNRQTSPTNLLVLLFNYNNSSYALSDEEIEKQWSDYIFGSGSIEDKTASVNDYFKEVSNGKFYFNPVLVGSNQTGVYSFHLDKDYSDEQGLHSEYPSFEFKYDIAHAMEELVTNGLDISPFVAKGITHNNYTTINGYLWDGGYDVHDSQWYSTYKILAVFPHYNTENVSLTAISAEIDKFSLYVHLNDDSTFGTLVHELTHTLGAMDTYNYGSFGSDLMSNQYQLIQNEFNTIHMNPYYKLLFGWVNPIIAEGNGNVTLYPQNSDKYNPIIIKTDDENQYYIIENRIGSGFDNVNQTDCEGINIWRIDKLGVEAIYNHDRKGIVLDVVLKNKNSSIELEYYNNKNDIFDYDLTSSNIEITYLQKNNDGSITININRHK